MAKNDKIVPGKEEEVKAETVATPADSVATEVEKAPSKDPKGEKMVTISESKMASLLDRIDKLESNAVSTQQNAPMVRNKAKETLIKMRMWEGEYVIGWVNISRNEKRPQYISSEYNPQTRETTLFINLILLGKDKPVKVEYLNYLRESEQVWVKQVRKIQEESEIVSQGVVRKKEFAQNGYGMFETQVEVDVESITEHFSYEVLLETGDKITVDSRFIG